jgi:hypothetical protein
MNRLTMSSVEPLSTAAVGQPLSGPAGRDSRTLLKRCLLEGVLPTVTLLSMSVLTIAMIVLIVTTVAHAGWLEPSTYVSVDPWAGMEPVAALHAGDAPQPEAGYGADTGRFASGAAQ